jgi:hypothetical protein
MRNRAALIPEKVPNIIYEFMVFYGKFVSKGMAKTALVTGITESLPPEGSVLGLIILYSMTYNDSKRLYCLKTTA